MVRVEPPSDWVPPPGYPPSDGDSSSMGSFEDIDSILGQADSVASPSSTKSKKTRPSSKKQAVAAPTPLPINAPAASRPRQRDRTSSKSPSPQVAAPPIAVPPIASEKPVLPGNDWTSEATKKRKRMILMIASAIGTVVAVAAIIGAIVVNSGSRVAENDGPEAGQTDPQNDLAQNDSPEKVGEPDADATNQNGSDAPGGDLDETPTGGEFVPSPIDQDNAIGKAPEVPQVKEGPFSAPGTQASTDDASNNDPPGSMPLLPGSDGSFAGNKAIDPSPVVDPNTIEVVDQDDGLGELGSLLEFADSSLQDLESVAANFESQPKNILTKYYVEKDDPEKIDVSRKLELPIPGWKSAKPIPLSQAVELMSTISGLPITIDARQIVLMGKPVDPLVSPQFEDVTVLEAIATLGQIQNDYVLTPIPTETGVVMTIPALNELVDAEIEFPKVSGLELNERERFVASIETIISPEEWTRKENPGSIKLVGDKIQIKSTIVTQKLVRMFVEKLNASVVLMSDADNADAANEVASRWALAQTKMMADPQLKPGASQDIGGFFARIKKQTGLTVLIDWDSVVRAGWWPTTRLPGEIVEPTNEAMLQEITLAMGLTPVAVDSETVLITTPEKSKSFIDLEVYPISERLSKEVTNDSLRELVFRLLGNQLNGQLVRVIYEPKCRCLIVVAPQAIQRQVEAIVRRLDPKK